ncbi:hypothetical protein ACLOAV_002659 [Pseudogymnoascus australis]
MLFSKTLAVATLLLGTTSAYNLMGYSNQDCTGDETNQGGTDVPHDECSPCLRFPWPVKSFRLEDTSDTIAANSAVRDKCFDRQMDFDVSVQGGIDPKNNNCFRTDDNPYVEDNGVLFYKICAGIDATN